MIRHRRVCVTAHDYGRLDCRRIGALMRGFPRSQREAFARRSEGRVILRADCARYHAIRETGRSPRKDAPPFRPA
jgi:hypothetical protein